MVGPLVIGSGDVPDICALPGGGWLAVYREVAGITLVWLTRDGVEIARFTFDPGTTADSCFPKLTVFNGLPWLAYRALRGGLNVAVVRVVTNPIGDERILGTTLGNDPVCLSSDGWCAWQEQQPDGSYDVHGIRLDSGESQILASKAVGTGIARCDGGVIVFVDDNHGSVPGMLDPVMVGACTVGKAQNGGIAVLMQDGKTGVLLPGQDTGDPRVADGGAGAYAAVCWGPLGVRFVTFTEADVVPAPFAFAPFNHPVLIAPFKAQGSGAIDLFDVGLYTEATEPADLAAVIGIATQTNMRVLLAHDSPAPWVLPAGLRPWDVLMYELYLDPADGIGGSVIRWFFQLPDLLKVWPGDVGLIPMFYTQDRWTIAEVLGGLTMLTQAVNLSPRIKIVAPFEYNRANGITAHPELQAAFTSLLKATPGTPTLIPIGSTPAPAPVPQPTPKPKPTPAPAPAPVPPPQPETEMQLPARCYALLHNSNIATLAPGATKIELAHVPQEYAAYQEVEVTKSSIWTPIDPRVLVRLVAGNRLFRVDKVLAGQQKYDQCVETWDPAAADADSVWQQGLAAGPFVHYTSDSADGQRHGVVYTLTCVDASGQLFQ